ncbi:50S ribosomal protein L21e [Candidatus Gugararchaeum adminiculabundum]|nr:50S ribosomal protein L21e [Candidatus Gugararchaeum adminiculabundum]
MVKASKGYQVTKTRSLRKGRKKKLGATRLFTKYKVGDSVTLLMTSGFSGMPHGRYRGRTGKVIGIRGNAYVVKVRDMNGSKQFAVPSVHLRKA